MTDRVEIRRLEQYLFSKNKEEFLKGLVQGNYDTSYLNLLHIFNTKGKFEGADQKLLDSFLEQHGKAGASKSQNIFDFRNLLSQFEQAEGNQSKQEEVLEEIREVYFKQLRFHYNKPSNIGKTNIQKKDQNDGLKSTIDEKDLQFETLLETVYKQPNLIHKVSRHMLSRVDFTKISTSNKRQVLDFYAHLLQQGDIENWGSKLADLLVLYTNEYKSQNKNQNYIPHNIAQKATLEQIQQIQNKLSWLKNQRDFQQTVFQKTFLKLEEYQSKRNLSELTVDQKTEYRSFILEVIEWCKNQKNVIFQSLQDQMLYALLVIDRELEAYNKDLFLQYIQKPFRFHHCQLFYNFTDSHQKVIRDLKQEYNPWGINIVDQVSESSLVEDYLEFFFRESKDTSEFTKFFQENYLRRIFYRVKLQLGENFENISQFLSSHDVEELTNKKEITICRSNNRFFKAGEEIKLNVDIKNVKSMNVKVFEINTENYYIKKKSAFDNSINLEGINPLDQQVNLQFSENPIIKKRHEFKFERLTAIERGVFVIEFIGNGISSRAVIRKGALNYLEQKTLAGHEITLITENQEICKQTVENTTGIWLDDRFLKVNESGKITIPYGDSSRTATAILVHNNFAELTDITIQSEEYSFKVAYLYNDETFLGGNKAKIIVQPRLFINGIPCSMKLIQDAQIAAVLVNEQDISNNYNFKNLKLSPTEDILVEIPIQNLVRSIELKFTGKIRKLNGDYQHLNDSMNVRFNLYESSNKLDGIYLRNTKDGYFLNILGKNGEPKEGQMVDFTFNFTYSNDSKSVRAKTDEKGQIKLGKLKGIFQFLARYQNYQQNYQIQRANQIQYPTNVVITEEDEFSLPALSSEINQHTYSLTETQNSYNLNDCLSKIVYNNNRIQIKGLTEGNYVLKIKESDTQIRINVIKGDYWIENNQFIVSEKQNAFIQRSISVDQSLAILECKVQEQNKLKLKVLLPENVGQKGALDIVRAHVIAYNFLGNNQDQLCDKLRGIQGQQLQSEIQFGMKKSVFLNNAKLGDEICYVLERQNQKKYIGNTLEKPNILLKRTFVRDTNFDKEELAQDQAYSQGLEDRYVNEKAMRRDMTNASMIRAGAHNSFNRQAFGSGPGRETGTDSMLNFLKNPCYVKCNIKVDEKGECVIEDFPADQYSSVQIILNNLSACVSNDFVIEEIKEVSYKDQRLKSQLKAGEAFLEKRGSKMVLKGEKTNILSGSECVIIDNVAQFFDIQKQLKLTTSNRDSENDRGYVFWDFLKNWNILSESEKLNKYDEFACHEVNIFLYMKDRQFFEKVVYNFIQNKLQKSFVDYFLLNDKEELLRYANPQNTQSMNYMEKCLLISHLAQNGQEEQALQQQKALEMESINYPQDTQLRNRLFDTVISAKQQQAAEQQQQQMQQLQQQIMFDQEFSMEKQCMMMEEEEEMACMGMQPQMAMMSRAAPAPKMMMKKKAAAPQSMMMAQNSALMMDEMAVDRQIQQRQEFKPGYQKLKKTKEYIERTYYNMKNSSYQKDHITYSEFWVKFAAHIVQNQGRLTDFIDESFIYATQNHADMICCLAFTALEFEGGSFEMKAVEDRQIEIKSGRGNVIIFLKNIVKSKKDLKAEISINQRFFDPSDRYIYLEDDPTVQVEKTVEEFLPQKIYGLKYIVTNCSIASLEFQILTEIPEGSLPVNSVYYTKSHTLNLASYQTEQIEILFYFPQIGNYKCFPANVSRNGIVWAEANNQGEVEVKPELTIKKMDNFSDIIKNGSQEDILKFVAEKNIKNRKVFRFSDIYWLLKEDKAFYLKFIEILSKRKIFDLEAWTLCLYHKVPALFVELFENKQFQQSYMSNYTKIRAINTKLFKINDLTIFEYHPLLSSRAHSFMNEQKSKILNVEFKQTYEKFLQYLVEKPQPDVCDLLTFSYYLLLQERIEESIQIFESIKTDTLASSGRIQYDYMAAYLNIYNGFETNFSVAREVAKKYIDYPIKSWKSLFIDLNNQLREFDGEIVDDNEQVKESELNKNLKAGKQEEEISYELDKQEIVVTYQNISSFQIFYYEVDLEILFSRTPFINQIRDDFAFVKANKQEKIALEKSNLIQTTRVKIPTDLANKNLYILLKSNNNVNNMMYFSNNLKVQLIKNYGQVKVLNEKNLPQSKVYVKCFARQNNGEEYFYRDGYTDLRGRFDYALSSSSDVDKISKFSILISSENNGAIIKEVGPPSKLGRIENEEE